MKSSRPRSRSRRQPADPVRQEKYRFGSGFQIKAVALMARDPMFLHGYADAVHSQYFDTYACGILAAIVKNYWAKHGTLPTRTALETSVSDHCSRHKCGDEIQLDLFSTLQAVMDADLADRDFMIEKIISFGRRQAVRDSVLQIADLLERSDDDVERDFEAGVALLQSSLMVGSGCTDLGFDFREHALVLPELARDSALYSVNRRVPTRLETLDVCLKNGLAPGELGIVVGYTGRGKSVTLVNFAAAAIEAGIPIVYYSFELHEVDVSLRLAARLSHINMDDIIAGCAGSSYISTMASLIQSRMGNGSTKVKYWPPKTVKVGALRSHLSRLIAIEGVKPGLILVDYADKIVGGRGGDTYIEMGDVCDGLIGIAHDFDVPVWTASQVRREADFKKKLDDPEFYLDLDCVADSFRKSTDADTVLTLNQTRLEKEEGLLRLYTAKVRRGEDGRKIPCTIDYNKMCIQERWTVEGNG